MYIVCSDLEGVFVPEVWINVAQKTGIEELKLTTRDIQDYDELMQKRLSILQNNGLKLTDIQQVIDTINPLEGAVEFLDWLRTQIQVIIVSDTFIEFAAPLMKKLNRPTLLCNDLTVDENNRIVDYNIRQKDPKRKVVQAFNGLNYNVIACGDSYNDISMLQEAQQGVLFSPPDNVVNDHPDLPVTRNYEELKAQILPYL